LWSIQTGTQVRSFPDLLLDPPYQVDFSSDGKYILTEGDKGALLWDVQTSKILHNFGRESAGLFSPDGRYVFMNAGGNTVSIWEVATLKQVRAFQPPRFHHAYELSPDDRYAILGDLVSNDFQLWDIQRSVALGTFTIGNYDAVPYVFSPNGHRILINANINKHTYRIWDIPHDKQTGTFVADDYVSELLFSPNNKYLFGAIGDLSALYRWNADTFGKPREFC